MATALTLATQARRVKTRDPSNILNDKPNGIYILPTAPMPTEKLITYLQLMTIQLSMSWSHWFDDLIVQISH